MLQWHNSLPAICYQIPLFFFFFPLPLHPHKADVPTIWVTGRNCPSAPPKQSNRRWYQNFIRISALTLLLNHTSCRIQNVLFQPSDSWNVRQLHHALFTSWVPLCILWVLSNGRKKKKKFLLCSDDPPAHAISKNIYVWRKKGINSIYFLHMRLLKECVNWRGSCFWRIVFVTYQFPE